MWLAIQLAGLALGAFRISLWADFPTDEDRCTLQTLLWVQTAGAAMLFPVFFRSWQTTILSAISSWPFLFIAASIEAAPWEHAVRAVIQITLWVIALGTLQVYFRKTPRWVGVGPTLAAAFALGAPLLFYLREEFGDGQPIPPPRFFSNLFIAASAACIFSAVIFLAFQNSMRKSEANRIAE